MKNLKVILQLFAIAFVVVIASSCRDEFTEKDAIQLQSDAAAEAAQLDASLSLDQQRAMELLRDSLARVGGVIQYTVSVVDAGDAIFFDGNGNSRIKGTKAVAGAVVSVAQNGAIASVTTGADGLAFFDDMRIGNVAVNVAIPDFTDVNFVADLTPVGLGGSSVGDSPDYYDLANITRNAATQIPVFPTAGANTTTISGRVTFESDLTNNTPEIPATNVVAVIDPACDFITSFIAPEGGAANEDQAGRVLRISYSSAAVSAAVDATTGDYSLTVPASAMGLDILIGTSDLVADQTLLEETYAADMQYVIGPQVHRALFGEDISATTIPNPSAAWVSFSAPAGATGDGDFFQATAHAVVGESGFITSVIVTNAGHWYTQVPDVVFTDTDGYGAAATANLGPEGVIESVTVTDGGQGYYADVFNPDVTFEFSGDDAVIDVSLLASLATEDGTGDPLVIDISGLSNGDDFTTIPTPTFVNNGTGTGTGAAATAYGFVSDATTVNASGSGYVAKYQIDDGGGNNLRLSGPELVIGAPDFPGADITSAAPNDQAEGHVNIQGPITAVALSSDAATNDGDGFVMDSPTTPTLPVVTVSPAGATTTVTMSETNGYVYTVALLTAGSGYTERPNLDVSGNANWRVKDMGVDAVTATAGNQYRYSDAPTATFSTPDGGGGTATGTVQLTQVVSSVWLDVTAASQATGYTVAPVFTSSGGGATTDAVITGTIAGGALTGFTITNPGAGFTSDPTWAYTSGDDPNGIAGNIKAGFRVAAVNVTGTGNGYVSSSDAAVTISAPSDATTDAGLGNAFASPTTATGSVTLFVNSIEEIQPGSGYDYTASNTATFTGGGGSTPTQATASVFIATSIESVAVATGGTYTTGDQDGYDYFGLSVSHTAPGTPPTGLAGGDYTSFGSDDDGQVWVTGSVIDVQIDNGGDGYSTAPTMTADDTDGGSGATFDVLVNDNNVFMWVTAGGSDYVVNSTGKVEVDVEYNGNSDDYDSYFTTSSDAWTNGLLDLSIADGGSGYTADPWVLIEGTGFDDRWLDYSATASGGAVTALTENVVRTYDTYPTVTIKTWREAAVAEGRLANSGIIAVEIDNAGFGYDVAPDVVFGNPGAGSGAAATAVINDGKVVEITIDDPGSGYFPLAPPQVWLIIPNTPYVAQGRVNVNEKGVVSGIQLYDLGSSSSSAGYGYIDPPTITISPSMTGVGSGATAVAEINNGKVTNVMITNGGSGYFARNWPNGSGQSWSITPSGSEVTAYPNKAVVKDISLGTGYRD
jgi:hypothetical protein